MLLLRVGATTCCVLCICTCEKGDSCGSCSWKLAAWWGTRTGAVLAVGPRERVEKSNGIAVSPPAVHDVDVVRPAQTSQTPRFLARPNSTSFARSAPRLPFCLLLSPSESLHGYHVSRIEQYTFSWTTVFSPRLGCSPPSIALHRKRCYRLTQGRPIIASRHPPSPSDPEHQGHHHTP